MPTQAELTDSTISDIASQYEKYLVIPDYKPKNQFILCPVGLVGAGKTTVVKPLSEKLSLIRVSGDEIRKLLKESGYGYERTQDIVAKVTKKYLNEEYSVCSDNDCASPRTQENLKKFEKEYNLKLIWIHINPPEEFILNKLRNLKPNWLGTAEQMIENYYQRKPLHKNLDFPFLYTFNTSKENLFQQIDEATGIIRQFTNNI